MTTFLRLTTKHVWPKSRFLASVTVVIMGATLEASASGQTHFSGQRPPPQRGDAREILVAAAISLKDAFREIAQLYENRTGTKVSFDFGASGVLQKQIEGGAPVDVFASADEKQMDALAARALIIAETRRDFARNTLVLAVPSHAPVPIHSFQELENPNLTRVAIGNPKTVPAGQYARQLLENLNLWDALQPKLIFAENVRQVLDYVMRGEVDAGIVYASDVRMASERVSVAARAPKGFHDPIRYPIAVIRETRHPEASRRFVDLVLSAEGQEILHKHGFLSTAFHKYDDRGWRRA